MKIILLTHDRGKNHYFFKGLFEALKRNHEVIRMFHAPEPLLDGDVQCAWGDFELDKIEAFNPDRIIVFNGFAKETSAATHYLKKKYKLIFAERGWFPQEGNLYLDPYGLGARSMLACTNLSTDTGDHSREIDTLRDKFYNYKEIHDDYLLLPLQLENDTSIIYDSQYFKTMDSLMRFVALKFKGEKVIVTKHPLIPTPVVPEGLTLANRPTAELAKSAKAVIGINSTSIIESLVHYKPIVMFGWSVISGSGIIHRPAESLANPTNIARPNIDRINNVISKLLKRQFNQNEVPEHIIESILV
jgi:hypothetical protein